MVAAITSRSLTRRLAIASGRVRADEPRREHPPYAGQGMYLETTKQRPEDIETRQRMSEFFAPSKIFHLVNDQSARGDDESRWEIQKLVARDAATIQSAITDGRSKGAQAIVVSADPCFTENRRTVARCIDRRLPAGREKWSEPDRRLSRIRLSDKTSRLHPRHVVPKPGQAYEPEVPVQVRSG